MALPPFVAPLVRQQGRACRLRNRRNGETVATRVLPALDSAARRRGLLGRPGLEPGEAMVIAPTSAVHTWWMRFPIDVAFVRKDGTVVKTRAAVRPWRMTGALRAYCVVELEAGALARHDTREGDVLEIVADPAV